MKDSFGKAVMAHGMPEPRKFPSVASCQKRFLWTHEEVDPGPSPDSKNRYKSKRISVKGRAMWVESLRRTDFHRCRTNLYVEPMTKDGAMTRGECRSQTAVLKGTTTSG